MSKIVNVLYGSFIDYPKVFGNVKATYESVSKYLNTETPYLDRNGVPYPATYSRFNAMYKKQGFITVYTDSSLNHQECLQVQATTMNEGA